LSEIKHKNNNLVISQPSIANNPVAQLAYNNKSSVDIFFFLRVQADLSWSVDLGIDKKKLFCFERTQLYPSSAKLELT
jgi:hypothetical protein